MWHRRFVDSHPTTLIHVTRHANAKCEQNAKIVVHNLVYVSRIIRFWSMRQPKNIHLKMFVHLFHLLWPVEKFIWWQNFHFCCMHNANRDRFTIEKIYRKSFLFTRNAVCPDEIGFHRKKVWPKNGKGKSFQKSQQNGMKTHFDEWFSRRLHANGTMIWMR